MRPVIITSNDVRPRNTRRKGIKERILLGRMQSSLQNIVMIEASEGAEVEMHEVKAAESIYILSGKFQILTPLNVAYELKVGDLCYCEPGSQHALRCKNGPGVFLAIFAPPRNASTR